MLDKYLFFKPDGTSGDNESITEDEYFPPTKNRLSKGKNKAKKNQKKKANYSASHNKAELEMEDSEISNEEQKEIIEDKSPGNKIIVCIIHRYSMYILYKLII